MALDLDELAARARDGVTPSWNELREQRLLAAVRQAPPRVRRTRWRPLALGLAAAAALLLALSTLWPSAGPTAAHRSRLQLEDGSVCLLESGAQLSASRRSEGLVRLVQTRGRVRYDVSHRPERTFEVIAAPVTVRVRGTRFVVDIGPEAVTVSVEEGLVEVLARSRVTELAAGEALRVMRRGGRDVADAPRDPESPEASERAEAEAVSAEAPSAEASSEEALARRSPSTTETRSSSAQEPPAPLARRSPSTTETRSSSAEETPAPRARRRRAAPSPTDETRSVSAGVEETATPRARQAAPSAPEETPSTSETPEQTSNPPPESDPAALLAQADGYRRAGRQRDAAAVLERFLLEHSSDVRAPSAAFTLGRVRRGLGEHAAAAHAFARAYGAAPNGPLAEDSLAYEALSWAAAGYGGRAASAARRYLVRYPVGLHARRLQPLASP